MKLYISVFVALAFNFLQFAPSSLAYTLIPRKIIRSLIQVGRSTSICPNDHVSRFSPLQASVADSEDSTITESSSSKATNIWFPTRIQETLDYQALVQSMYLRHIVTETKAMADIAVKEYLAAKHVADPFGEVAASLSACVLSRDEGGKIGWVDQPQDLKENSHQSQQSLLPLDVVKTLFADLQPKAGDVHIVQSTATQQYHAGRYRGIN